MKQPTEEQAKMPEEEKSSHEFELVGKKARAKNELLLQIAQSLWHIWENGKEHYVSIVRISTSVEKDVRGQWNQTKYEKFNLSFCTECLAGGGQNPRQRTEKERWFIA